MPFLSPSQQHQKHWGMTVFLIVEMSCCHHAVMVNQKHCHDSTFFRSDALLVAQPTPSKHYKHQHMWYIAVAYRWSQTWWLQYWSHQFCFSARCGCSSMTPQACSAVQLLVCLKCHHFFTCFRRCLTTTLLMIGKSWIGLEAVLHTGLLADATLLMVGCRWQRRTCQMHQLIAVH